jgi:hypothetical protein
MYASMYCNFQVMDRAGANRVYESDILMWDGLGMWVVPSIESESGLSVSESIAHMFDEWIEDDPYASALR